MKSILTIWQICQLWDGYGPHLTILESLRSMIFCANISWNLSSGSGENGNDWWQTDRQTDIWRITSDHKSLPEPLAQVNLKSKQYYVWIELNANQWRYHPNQKWCNVLHFRWSEMIGSNSFISYINHQYWILTSLISIKCILHADTYKNMACVDVIPYMRTRIIGKLHSVKIIWEKFANLKIIITNAQLSALFACNPG